MHPDMLRYEGPGPIETVAERIDGPRQKEVTGALALLHDRERIVVETRPCRMSRRAFRQ